MNKLSKLLKNKTALSTVITTLIILVVSILLASVLTYFAVNVVSTRVQEESLYVSRQHIWVNSAGAAEGAVMVTNNGGRDVVINKVAVRGQQSAWDTVFYAVAGEDDDLTTDLSYVTAPVEAENGGDHHDLLRSYTSSGGRILAGAVISPYFGASIFLFCCFVARPEKNWS